jgi:hypothetical protein
MRRLLAACGIAALLAAASPAHAEIAVIDLSQIEQTIALLKQQVKSYAAQLRQVEEAAQQIEWAKNTFDSMVDHPNLANAMGLLREFNIQDPLPVDPYTIQGLISGQGGINGALGALSTLSDQSFDRNHIYTPNDGTWASREMAANANGIAGAQGVAQQVYQQLGDHFQILQALRTDALNATTPAEREHVMAQIQAEQAWAQNATGQLQAANILLVAERDNRAQRENEMLTRSIDKELDEARAEGIIP